MPKTIQFTSISALTNGNSLTDGVIVTVQNAEGEALNIYEADLPIMHVVLFDLMAVFGYTLEAPKFSPRTRAAKAGDYVEGVMISNAHADFKSCFDDYLRNSSLASYNGAYPVNEKDLLGLLKRYACCVERVATPPRPDMDTPTERDPVKRPSHYQLMVFDAAGIGRDVEVLDITDSLLADIPKTVSFSTGACYKEAITYLMRMWKKGTPVQDAEKAVFYLTRMINSLKMTEGFDK